MRTWLSAAHRNFVMGLLVLSFSAAQAQTRPPMPTDEELRRAFDAADVNKGGVIDIDESVGNSILIFAVLDKNKDGCLSFDELPGYDPNRHKRADRGDRRPLVLFYGNRASDRVAFREELDALAARLNLRAVHVLLDQPDDWAGERGFVSEEILMRHLPPERHPFHCFLCGPTPMTTSVEQSLAALGIPAAQVHSEIFDWV